MISRWLKERGGAGVGILSVAPFKEPFESQFQSEQVKVSCTFLGVGSVVGFSAYTFFFLFFFFNFTGIQDIGHSPFSRRLSFVISLYFAFTAYILLKSKSSQRVKEAVALSFAYVIVLLVPFVDLFRPINKIGYDLVVMSSTVLCIAGASRFTHRKAIVWLVTVVSAFFVVQFFFFGMFGPDSEEIAKNPTLVTGRLRGFLYLQVLQAAIFAYMIFRVIEARERVLFLRERQLEKAAEDRLHLLQGIGHDLRQPMTALMLHSDYARQCARTSEFQRMDESLRVIEENLHLMNSELTQVTELTASADPSSKLVLKPLQILPIIESLLASFRPRAENAHIDFRVNTDAISKSLYVFSDELLLRRCLSNLVSNAFKFTALRTVGDAKFVALQVDVLGDFVEISVADSGIGIAKENRERIWEPFFQIGNPARNSDMGFGLGLAHVRAAIDRMTDHSISLASALGEGARFTIRVPVSTEIPTSTDFASNNVVPIAGDQNAFKGSLFLLVEDDALLRASLSRAFESWGGRVADAHSVESAKKLIDSLEVPPDFAIIDYRLPDGDGRDVFRYIESLRSRTEGWHCHWVCLTGEHATNLTKLDGTAISIIRKPVTLGMLYSQLNEIVKARGKV
jgi:signal transduction histidine kinase/ActR/RegA family two-component response regulator